MHPVWPGPSGTAPRCTHMSEQRAENETCRAVYGVRRPGCSIDRTCSARGPPWCTPPSAPRPGAAGRQQVFACCAHTDATSATAWPGRAGPGRVHAHLGSAARGHRHPREARGVESAESARRRSRAFTPRPAKADSGAIPAGWPTGQIRTGARADGHGVLDSLRSGPRHLALERGLARRPLTSAPSSERWQGTWCGRVHC